MFFATLKKMFGAKGSSKFVGISIHPDMLKLVILEKGESLFKCVKSESIKLSGEDQLTSVLAKLIEENELKKAITSLVLPANKVQSSQIEFEDLPASDIQQALPWQLKELISIPPQDMICDYIDMPLQPFGQTAKAQVVATSRQYLEKLTLPFHEAKAQVSHILTEQFAIAQMQLTKDAAQLVFIQHPNTEAVLLILKNQQICFARKIRGTDAVLNMPEEQLKYGGTDNISIEIQRSIDYYESQLKQPPIKDVYLAVESPIANIIVDALNQSLPVRTKSFPFDDIVADNQLDVDFIPALGAALTGVVQEEEEQEA